MMKNTALLEPGGDVMHVRQGPGDNTAIRPISYSRDVRMISSSVHTVCGSHTYSTFCSCSVSTLRKAAGGFKS